MGHRAHRLWQSRQTPTGLYRGSACNTQTTPTCRFAPVPINPCAPTLQLHTTTPGAFRGPSPAWSQRAGSSPSGSHLPREYLEIARIFFANSGRRPAVLFESMDFPPTPPLDPHLLRVQQLFVQHRESLLAYVCSIEPNFSDAQDILQEVFLTLSRKAHAWTDGTNFLAWACTVSRYETLNFQRTRSRRTARLNEDVMELLYSGEIPTELRLQEYTSALQDCMDRLAPTARELILRRYHRNQSPAEIAAEMGWKPNAVSVALTRARHFLRECAGRLNPSPTV